MTRRCRRAGARHGEVSAGGDLLLLGLILAADSRAGVARHRRGEGRGRSHASRREQVLHARVHCQAMLPSCWKRDFTLSV